MINDLQIDSLLDGYLKGAHTKKELDAIFLSNGIENSESYIRIHQAASEAIGQYNILKQVQLVHQQYVQQNRTNTGASIVSMKKTWLRLAATVLILLGSFTIFQYVTSSYEAIFQDVYHTYSAGTSRSSDQTGVFVETFQRRDYKGTIQLFERMEVPGIREMFFAGNAYLETGNTEKATGLFLTILKHNAEKKEQLYQDEAEYYLAMAYLRSNEREKAVTLLEKINTDKSHTYNQSVSRWQILRLKFMGH